MKVKGNISTDVSIIVPSFKGETFFTQIIENLKYFHDSGYEIIFIENGPKGAIQERLIERLPNTKYFYLSEPNVSVARNLGVANSTRGYIQFLDVDDTISRGKLTTQLEAAVEHGLDMVYSDWRYVNHFLEETVEESWQSGNVDLVASILDGHWHPLHSYLFRKKCIDDLGGFDQSYQTSHEDTDMIFNFLLDLKTGYVAGEFTYYHRYEGHKSSSYSRGYDFWQDRQQFIMRYYRQIHNLHSDIRNIRPSLGHYIFSLIRNMAKFNYGKATEIYKVLKEIEPQFYPSQESRLFQLFYRFFGYEFTEIVTGLWHKIVPDKHSQDYELVKE